MFYFWGGLGGAWAEDFDYLISLLVKTLFVVIGYFLSAALFYISLMFFSLFFKFMLVFDFFGGYIFDYFLGYSSKSYP